jgi:hypothetical protein
MSQPSPTSLLVSFVHKVFCKGLEISSKTTPAELDRRSVERIQQYKDKLLLWTFCHKVVDLKREHDLDRSYLEVREGIIQKLIRMRKAQREDIDSQTRQLEHVADVIKGLEERRFHYAHEVERYKSQGVDVQAESLQRLEARLKEFDEELSFRQNVMSVQMELAQAKFPQITQLEEELEQLEVTRKNLEQQAEVIAQEMGLPKGLGKTLFFYMLNDGYFSYITDNDWSSMIFNCTSKEQSWLKEHFTCVVSQSAWLLNDEQHYYSPLKRKAIVGSRDSSGISFLDYNIKKLLDEKLVYLSFTRYQDDVRTFYASMCFEALEDGILTKDEVQMMDELAGALRLDPLQARQLLNQEALRVQKDFINENMALFYELAMSDGNMHREEAKFLVEMKNKLEGDMVENVAVMVQRVGDEGLQLKMDDSEFFVELCRLALKDKHLDDGEQEILKAFVQRKGWPNIRLVEMLEAAR